MAGWVKKVLFGRQLSHGSDNENPRSFEEAFQEPQAILNVSNLSTVSQPLVNSNILSDLLLLFFIDLQPDSYIEEPPQLMPQTLQVK